MGKTPTDSLPLMLNETGSSSQVDDPSSASNSECLVVVSLLPQELITEILVRLPVKSLSKFKCVSKPWLSLITNPQFIRLHFSKSSSMAEADGLNLELLFIKKASMKKCSLYSALQEADPYNHVTPIEFPAHVESTHHPIVVGIINGLVCLNLKGTDDLCIWNPALNKIKHFYFYPKASSGVDDFFSFGYEEPNDDYKVVCLQTDGLDAKVHIYSLKTDSWRRIDQLEGFCLDDPGVFAYGKIYWSDDILGISTPNGKIVTLDMSTEKFVQMQPPEYDECLLKMEVSGGRPFLLCDYEGMKVDLWVLDKHGVEESWSKLVSIPYTDANPNLYCFDYRVVCISRICEIVFGDEYGLLVYNWKKKEYRNIRLNVGIKTFRRMGAYVESLIWPNHV